SSIIPLERRDAVGAAKSRFANKVIHSDETGGARTKGAHRRSQRKTNAGLPDFNVGGEKSVAGSRRRRLVTRSGLRTRRPLPERRHGRSRRGTSRRRGISNGVGVIIGGCAGLWRRFDYA